MSDPSLDTHLRELRLVVLIARQADELAISFRFRLGMVVAFGGSEAENLGTLLFKTMLELIHGIAEVVGVARLVTKAKDRNFFAGKIQRGERAVQKVVPACPGSLSVCIRVPCGRTADEGISCSQLIRGAIAYVFRLNAELSRTEEARRKEDVQLIQMCWP